MSNLVGLNVGLSDSLSAKTRRYADYYRQLAAGTIKEVYDDETTTLSACFYRSAEKKQHSQNVQTLQIMVDSRIAKNFFTLIFQSLKKSVCTLLATPQN